MIPNSEMFDQEISFYQFFKTKFAVKTADFPK